MSVLHAWKHSALSLGDSVAGRGDVGERCRLVVRLKKILSCLVWCDNTSAKITAEGQTDDEDKMQIDCKRKDEPVLRADRWCSADSVSGAD